MFSSLPRLALYLLLFFPLTVYSTPEKDIEFSAYVNRYHPLKPEKNATGRMFVSRWGVRSEGKHGNKKIIFIYNNKKKKVWLLFPENKTYIQEDGAPERPPLPDEANSPCNQNKNYLCQRQGKVFLKERLTWHWLISTFDKKGKKFHHLWIDPRLKVAIREQYDDGLIMEFSQIREEPQPEALFQLPSNYRRLASSPEEIKHKK
ncbi:hypothetical protein ACQZV8_12490 [Magnetococcales bacterium HHB-1]